MKTKMTQLVIATLVIGATLSASAGTIACVVSAEDQPGMFTKTLVVKMIQDTDQQPQLLLTEGEVSYYAEVMEDGGIAVLAANPAQKKTFAVAMAKGSQVVLIEAALGRSVACSRSTSQK